MSYQREYDRRLSVAVVGVGSHAYRNVLPALHYLPVRLAALCDLNEPSVRRTADEFGVAAFTDTSEMYSAVELDAILICAGPSQHPALAVEALEAGIDVWMEKPPAIRADEVEHIMSAAGDRVCAVGFKKAYLPAVQKAKELMALPEFGELRSLLAVYPTTLPTAGDNVMNERRKTDWLSNGCHPISAMVELGGPVSSVRSVLGPGEEAVGSVHLEFASGAIGTFFLAGGAPLVYPVERYELFGHGRAITIDDSSKVSYHRGIPYDYDRQTDFTGPGADTGSVVWEAQNRLASMENMAMCVQGLLPELLDFCGAVLDGRPLRTCDLPFALEVMRIYEAALRSGGEIVRIDQTETRPV